MQNFYVRVSILNFMYLKIGYENFSLILFIYCILYHFIKISISFQNFESFTEININNLN